MMKRFFLFCFLALCVASVGAQGKIAVRVTGFRNNKGVCLIGLYDNATSFAGKGNPTRVMYIPVVNNTADAFFENVPAGTYAISVIHDANNNRRFDKNFIGIPTEGYGASGNKLPFAAAPKFDANSFLVCANAITTITIKLRYLF